MSTLGFCESCFGLSEVFILRGNGRYQAIRLNLFADPIAWQMHTLLYDNRTQ